MVAHAGRLWFLGGMDNHDEPSLEVDWFEPKSATWGKGPKLPVSPMSGFADDLVKELMKRLADNFAVERSRLEEQWEQGKEASTEDLRTALQQYRSFFRRLLVT